MGALEWAGIGLLDFFDDLGYAVGPEKWRAFALLELTHLLGHVGALVE